MVDGAWTAGYRLRLGVLFFCEFNFRGNERHQGKTTVLYLTILLGFLFFAAVAMTINEGLWNNTILLFGVMLAGLFAIFGGMPLGGWAAERAGSSPPSVWYFVFGGIWGAFALAITVFRVVAERISPVRMKFVPPLEMVAGPLMGLFVAVMFTSFAFYTLERVPIKAGEWDLAQAAAWQKTAFMYGRAPFYNVVKSFAQAEGVTTLLTVSDKTAAPRVQKPAVEEAVEVPVDGQ